MARHGWSGGLLAGQAPDLPTRRGVLTGLLTVGGAGLLGGLTGCDAGPAAPVAPPPGADELAVRRAVADARRLRDDALARTGVRPALEPVLRRIAADHEAHLAALGASVTPSATAASATASDRSSTASTRAVTAADRVRAEWSGARTALRDVAGRPAGLAALLARIAAARAVHADVIATAAKVSQPSSTLQPAPPPATASETPSGTHASSIEPSSAASTTPGTGVTGLAPTATPTQSLAPAARRALEQLLRGEHAAVFAYPIVISRSTGNRRAAATTLWQEHIRERDTLERQLVAAGVDPPAAAAAYDVGAVPTTSQEAAQLAARVENALAAVAVDGVAATTGAVQLACAQQLVTAARRARMWGAPATALPGGSAVTTTPTATGTAVATG